MKRLVETHKNRVGDLEKEKKELLQEADALNRDIGNLLKEKKEVSSKPNVRTDRESRALRS